MLTGLKLQAFIIDLVLGVDLIFLGTQTVCVELVVDFSRFISVTQTLLVKKLATW